MSREYYLNILDLSAEATTEDIKKAYRKKAKKYHPDINQAPEANKIFLLIQEAYDVLINGKIIRGIPKSDPIARQKREEQWRYREMLREIRRKERRRAEKRYQKFRGSANFLLIKAFFYAMMFAGICFLLLPFLVYSLVIERGILISIFCIPIGLHIINISYINIKSLYPLKERKDLWFEKIKRKYFFRGSDYLIFTCFVAGVVLESLFIWTLVKLGLDWILVLFIGLAPAGIILIAYAISQYFIKRGSEKKSRTSR